jgi:hypothetical protein
MPAPDTYATSALRRTIKALTADGKLSVETVILPDGEDHKSLDVVAKVGLRQHLEGHTTTAA